MEPDIQSGSEMAAFLEEICLDFLDNNEVWWELNGKEDGGYTKSEALEKLAEFLEVYVPKDIYGYEEN